jgi:DNA gyrase subunit B
MKTDYHSNNIVVLTGLAAMRKRPGMYLGDIDSDQGLQQLLWEALANSLDQHAAGLCQTIWLEFAQGNRVTVTDDGPGFLDRMIDETPLLMCALTQLHASASLTGHTPHDHLSDYGIGLVAIAAYSSELTLRTTRDGIARSVAMKGGEVTQPEQREASVVSHKYIEVNSDAFWPETRREDAVSMRSLGCSYPTQNMLTPLKTYSAKPGYKRRLRMP